MTHKTIIGGTAYEISGGKTLIGGTAYDITGGRTSVGGTGYDITFNTSSPTMADLFSNATLVTRAGRDSSTVDTVSLKLTAAGTYYILSFCTGYMSVNKVVYDGTSCTKTILGGIYNLSYGQIYISGNTVYYSQDGDGLASVYGANLTVFQFPGYDEADIDNIFASATYRRRAYRNNSSKRDVYYSTSILSTGYVFAAWSSYAGFSYVENEAITNYYGGYTANPSLLWHDATNGRMYLSTSSSGYVAIYGGSIIQVS